MPMYNFDDTIFQTENQRGVECQGEWYGVSRGVVLDGRIFSCSAFVDEE